MANLMTYSEEIVNEQYKEDDEEPTTMTIFPSVFNKCIKRLGGNFTLGDLERKYTKFKPKVPKTKVSSMPLGQVQRFVSVFAFTAPAQSRLTITQARKQILDFLTEFPEFRGGTLNTSINLMAIRLEQLKVQYGIPSEVPVKINQFPEYGAMFVVPEVSVPPELDKVYLHDPECLLLDT